jgi:peptidoglycan hydrolase CwlO-like protein
MSAANYGIPLAAVVISAFSFIAATVFASRGAASTSRNEWMRTLEARIEDLERELDRKEEQLAYTEQKYKELQEQYKELQAEIRRLSRREIELMRKVLALENGND